MLTYFFNILFWFIYMSCFYSLDYYVLNVPQSLSFSNSLIVICLLSIILPSFTKFVMRIELFSFRKIKIMRKSEYIKLTKAVFTANFILFIIAYSVAPQYITTYSFAGITLVVLQVGFGIIQKKDSGAQWTIIELSCSGRRRDFESFFETE